MLSRTASSRYVEQFPIIFYFKLMELKYSFELIIVLFRLLIMLSLK